MSKNLFSLILLLSLIFQSISRRNLLEETTEKETEKETQQQTEEEDSCEKTKEESIDFSKVPD